MSQSRYRDLVVWQKSRALASSVYRVTKTFPQTEMFGLTQQMRRATVSVISNIAEGHGRQTIADIVRFLVMARGSLFELEAQLIVATDLEYVTARQSNDVCTAILEIIRMMNGLIRHYEKRAT